MQEPSAEASVWVSHMNVRHPWVALDTQLEAPLPESAPAVSPGQREHGLELDTGARHLHCQAWWDSCKPWTDAPP